MIRTTTHTKTYALMNAWAQSFPWDCLIRDTNCASATHDHDPMVDQPCAVPECGEPIRDRESCYRVTEQEGYVCWRHVHPDEGPKPYPAATLGVTDLVVRSVPGDQLARPVITIDPAMRFGRPHIKGISTDAIAGMVAAGESLDTVADEYGLTRHEVLLACWHEGIQGRYQTEWSQWANKVHGPLGGWVPLDVDALPDPPEIPRPTRKARR